MRRQLWQQKPSFAEVSDLDKAYYLDSIRKERNSFYLDSVSAEKVYLGYTFKEVQEKEHFQGSAGEGDQPRSGPQGRYERHAGGAAERPGEGIVQLQ